ncbi:hypothetical protein G6F68_021351 [Rhizopus microsporus]|nr:hypothetical protein G6F68_021351 [Rhizopus microsporus]
MGYIDVERIPGVEGVLIANQIMNPRQVESQMVEKVVQTRISFDDGGSWKPMTNVKGLECHDMCTSFTLCYFQS